MSIQNNVVDWAINLSYNGKSTQDFESFTGVGHTKNFLPIYSVDRRGFGDSESFSDSMVPERWFYGAMGTFMKVVECGMRFKKYYINQLRENYIKIAARADTLQFLTIDLDADTYTYYRQLNVTRDDLVARGLACGKAFIYPQDFRVLFEVEEDFLKGVVNVSIFSELTKPTFMFALRYTHKYFRRWVFLIFCVAGFSELTMYGSRRICYKDVITLPVYHRRNGDSARKCIDKCGKCERCMCFFAEYDMVSTLYENVNHRCIQVLYGRLYQRNIYDNMAVLSMSRFLHTVARLMSFQRWAIVVLSLRRIETLAFRTAWDYFTHTPCSYQELEEFFDGNYSYFNVKKMSYEFYMRFCRECLRGRYYLYFEDNRRRRYDVGGAVATLERHNVKMILSLRNMVTESPADILRRPHVLIAPHYASADELMCVAISDMWTVKDILKTSILIMKNFDLSLFRSKYSQEYVLSSEGSDNSSLTIVPHSANSMSNIVIPSQGPLMTADYKKSAFVTSAGILPTSRFWFLSEYSGGFIGNRDFGDATVNEVVTYADSLINIHKYNIQAVCMIQLLRGPDVTFCTKAFIIDKFDASLGCEMTVPESVAVVPHVGITKCIVRIYANNIFQGFGLHVRTSVLMPAHLVRYNEFGNVECEGSSICAFKKLSIKPYSIDAESDVARYHMGDVDIKGYTGRIARVLYRSRLYRLLYINANNDITFKQVGFVWFYNDVIIGDTCDLTRGMSGAVLVTTDMLPIAMYVGRTTIIQRDCTSREVAVYIPLRWFEEREMWR